MVALGFIKSLVDYIKPEDGIEPPVITEPVKEISEELGDVLDEDEEAWKEEIEDSDFEDEGPPWYDDDEYQEDLLDIATKKKEQDKRDSFLEDENIDNDN